METADAVLTSPCSSSSVNSSNSSDYSTFDVVLFWKLPYHIRRQIVENLSPLDYLHLAEVSQDFYDFLYNLPKRMHCADSLSDQGIWGWYGRIQRKPYRKTFVTWKIHPKAMQHMKNTEFEEYVIFKHALSYEEKNKLEQKQLRFLRNNAVLKKLSITENTLKENVKAKKISSWSGTWAELLEELEHTGATELYHCGNAEMNQDPKIRDVFENQLMQRLQCFHLSMSGSIMSHLSLLKADRMRFYYSEGPHDIIKHWDDFIDYLDTLVQEWKSGARQLDSFAARLAASYRPIPNEISGDLDDEMNFKYNTIAKRLAFGHDGGFINELTDRVQLIKRSDGRGLLIWSGAVALVMVECDYEYRRRAGYGNSAKRWPVFSELRKLAEQRQTRELCRERALKYPGKSKSGCDSEAEDTVVDCFGLFDDDNLNATSELDSDDRVTEPPKIEETIEERLRKKEEKDARIEAEEQERIKELLAELEFLEYSRSETNIDRLFDGDDDVVNLRLLQQLNFSASWPGDGYTCPMEEDTLSMLRGELRSGERFYVPPEA